VNDHEDKKHASDSKKKSKREHDPIAFQGGKYEASGAISVPGTDGILIVDDDNPSAVLWVRLDRSGKQIGSVQAVSLGTSIEDPEGITSDGAYYYIVGSQSNSVVGGQPGIVRFAFDPQSQRVSDVEVAAGLREFLFEKVPELSVAGAGKGASLISKASASIRSDNNCCSAFVLPSRGDKPSSSRLNYGMPRGHLR